MEKNHTPFIFHTFILRTLFTINYTCKLYSLIIIFSCSIYMHFPWQTLSNFCKLQILLMSWGCYLKCWYEITDEFESSFASHETFPDPKSQPSIVFSFFLSYRAVSNLTVHIFIRYWLGEIQQDELITERSRWNEPCSGYISHILFSCCTSLTTWSCSIHAQTLSNIAR